MNIFYVLTLTAFYFYSFLVQPSVAGLTAVPYLWIHVQLYLLDLMLLVSLVFKQQICEKFGCSLLQLPPVFKQLNWYVYLILFHCYRNLFNSINNYRFLWLNQRDLFLQLVFASGVVSNVGFLIFPELIYNFPYQLCTCVFEQTLVYLANSQNMGYFMF